MEAYIHTLIILYIHIVIIYTYNIRILCVGMSNKISQNDFLLEENRLNQSAPFPSESLWFVAHPRVMT